MAQTLLMNNEKLSVCRTLHHLMFDEEISKYDQIKQKEFYNDIEHARGESMSIPEVLSE